MAILDFEGGSRFLIEGLLGSKNQFSESSSECRRTYSKTFSRPRQPFWAPWWPLGIFESCSLCMFLIQEGLKSCSKRQTTFVYTTFQTLSLSFCFFVSLSLYDTLNDQKPIWDLQIQTRKVLRLHTEMLRFVWFNSTLSFSTAIGTSVNVEGAAV